MINPVDPNYSQYLDISPWSPPERFSSNKVSQSQFPPEIDGVTDQKNPTSGTVEKGNAAKECQTCKKRKYVDGSNDPGVSFKAPTSLSPEAAPMAVAGHENEHVRHERAKAAQQGREVVYQTVQIHTAICPECGRVYVSGGKTTTVTEAKPKPEAYLGKNIDREV